MWAKSVVLNADDLIINNIIINDSLVEPKIEILKKSPTSPERSESPFKSKVEFKISIEKWLVNKGFDTSEHSLWVKWNENIKGYIINDMIGRGINADVYQAWSVKTGANFALKIYKNDE